MNEAWLDRNRDLPQKAKGLGFRYQGLGVGIRSLQGLGFGMSDSCGPLASSGKSGAGEVGDCMRLHQRQGP